MAAVAPSPQPRRPRVQLQLVGPGHRPRPAPRWAEASAAYRRLAHGQGPHPVTWVPGRWHGRVIRLARLAAAAVRAVGDYFGAFQ